MKGREENFSRGRRGGKNKQGPEGDGGKGSQAGLLAKPKGGGGGLGPGINREKKTEENCVISYGKKGGAGKRGGINRKRDSREGAKSRGTGGGVGLVPSSCLESYDRELLDSNLPEDGFGRVKREPGKALWGKTDPGKNRNLNN